MTNQERGRRTGQHEQPDQQADLLQALKGLEDAAEQHYNVGLPGVDPDMLQMVRARAAIARAEGHTPEFRGCSEATEAMAPEPARAELSQPRDSDLLLFEESIAAMFTHPDRIHIEYEMRCEECMTWTTSARRKETRGGLLIVCMDCE